MEHNAKYFLNGMVRYLKPAKILEVGIASGGGSAIILNAIRDIENSQLISVDYYEKYYGFDEKLSGWLVDEKFSHLKNKWTVYRGGDISRFIENIGDDIDLLVLDTAHIHPWETLNFLCILPFLKRGAWVILHDVSLPYLSGREDELACRYLFANVVSDIKIMPVPEDNYIPHFSNIGAFHVIDDTAKYARNLFEALLFPWAAYPGMFIDRIFPCNVIITNEDIDGIRKIITKYYKDYAEFFDHAVEFQEGIARHKAERYRSFSGTWERNFPLSYRLINALSSNFHSMKKGLHKKLKKLFA